MSEKIWLATGSSIVSSTVQSDLFKKRLTRNFRPTDNQVLLGELRSVVDGVFGGAPVTREEIRSINYILHAKECLVDRSSEVEEYVFDDTGGLVARLRDAIKHVLSVDDLNDSAFRGDAFRKIIGLFCFDNSLLTKCYLSGDGGFSRLAEYLRVWGWNINEDDYGKYIRPLVKSYETMYYFYRMDFFAWRIIDGPDLICDSTDNRVYGNLPICAIGISRESPGEGYFLAAINMKESDFASGMSKGSIPLNPSGSLLAKVLATTLPSESNNFIQEEGSPVRLSPDIRFARVAFDLKRVEGSDKWNFSGLGEAELELLKSVGGTAVLDSLNRSEGGLDSVGNVFQLGEDRARLQLYLGGDYPGFEASAFRRDQVEGFKQ